MRFEYLRAVLLACALTIGLPAAAADPAPAAPAQPPTAPWPRAVNLSNAAVLVYQPQVDKWVDSQIDFRCAIAIKPTGSGLVRATFDRVTTKHTQRLMMLTAPATLEREFELEHSAFEIVIDRVRRTSPFVVLATAVRAHLQKRVLSHRNRTIVFE